jgi:UDP-glucose 4-epimerase
VTGGLGFIGSSLALKLHELGAAVTVIDALVGGHGGDPRNLDEAHGIEVIVADVGDREAVSPALRRADILFDLAGQGSHLASEREPELDFHLNATSRLRLLQILCEVNPHVRAVFTSTRQVYGRPTVLPVTEEMPPRPADVNGIAKLAAEHLYVLHHAQHGLESVLLRLSNVYGPRQHLRSDELGVLPVFIRRALRGESLVIFGEGEAERDPLHIDDALDALLAAAAVPEAVGQVMNVGHHERLTIKQMAEIIAAAVPSRPPIERRPWPSEHSAVAIGSSYMSSTLAEQTLGWRPTRSFDSGIRQTLAWFEARPERFR